MVQHCDKGQKKQHELNRLAQVHVIFDYEVLEDLKNKELKGNLFGAPTSFSIKKYSCTWAD